MLVEEVRTVVRDRHVHLIRVLDVLLLRIRGLSHGSAAGIRLRQPRLSRKRDAGLFFGGHLDLGLSAGTAQVVGLVVGVALGYARGLIGEEQQLLFGVWAHGVPQFLGGRFGQDHELVGCALVLDVHGARHLWVGDAFDVFVDVHVVGSFRASTTMAVEVSPGRRLRVEPLSAGPLGQHLGTGLGSLFFLGL